MSKLYFVYGLRQVYPCFREERDCTPYGGDKHCGYELPDIKNCSKCGSWYELNSILHFSKYSAWPFPCPEEIIEESEKLIATEHWNKKLYWPHFSAELLYPYLIKWTRILMEKGYKIDGILQPCSTFAPEFLLYYPSENFIETDFFSSSLNRIFVSERLKDALSECPGAYYIPVEIPYLNTKNRYFRIVTHPLLMSNVGLGQYDLISTRELLKRKTCSWGATVSSEKMLNNKDIDYFICPRCGVTFYTYSYQDIDMAKDGYCERHRIVPEHLVEPQRDIFPQFFASEHDYLFFSEKAYAILKSFSIPYLEAVEFEVRDDPLLRDEEYWKTDGLAEYGFKG